MSGTIPQELPNLTRLSYVQRSGQAFVPWREMVLCLTVVVGGTLIFLNVQIAGLVKQFIHGFDSLEAGQLGWFEVSVLLPCRDA